MLAIGEYKWLDKIVKLVVLVLAVTTLLCTFAVLDKLPLDSLRLLPEELERGFVVAHWSTVRRDDPVRADARANNARYVR